VLQPNLEQTLGQWFVVEESSEERRVREVAEQRPISGQQQLLRIVLTKVAGSHLALEVTGCIVERRPENTGQVDAEVGAVVQCLTAHQADVFGVVAEEPEPGDQHRLHLRPATQVDADRIGEAVEPVREETLENLAVENLLRSEVMQQARPADTHGCCDVVQRGSVVAGFGEAMQRFDHDLIPRREMLSSGDHCAYCTHVPSTAARRILTSAGLTGPGLVFFDETGTITAIEPTDASTPDVTLVPGFVDLQVNGIDDVDVAAARGEDWTRLGNLLLDQGVTAWCPTLVTNALHRFGVPLERMSEARNAAARRSANLPTIIGAHLEGPFLGGAPGAHPRHLIASIDLGWLGDLGDLVRLVTIAAEIPLAAQAAALLSRRGIVVSIGHSTPTAADMEAVVGAGASMVTHLFNGMSGVHHREPGLASVALVDDRLTVGLIADLVHVERRSIELAFRAKPADRIVLVTDAVAWRAGSVGEGRNGIRIELRDGAARLDDGTLAGSAVTMDQMIRNVVEVCGIPLECAVGAASTNPARLMGCTDRGAIDVGRRADLVALDVDLAVAGVWLHGARVR
jgi:N-acetylglucosamine-6-phosphate deacetylase